MRWIVSAVLCLAVLGVAGCGSGGETAAGSTGQSTQAQDVTSAPAAGALSAKDRAAYLAHLAKVDQGLVTNEDRAVRRGQSTCLDIKQGIKGSQLTGRVSQRFTGGNATVGTAEAKQIIAAVKRWLCKS